MKKTYFILSLMLIVNLAIAGERVWNIGTITGGTTVDHSTSLLTAPALYNTAKQVPLDNYSWTATECTSNCTQALELAPNFKIGAANRVDANWGSFSGRLQIDGLTPAPTPPAIPTSSYFSFNVIGNATIKIYCNPKDAVAKNLNMVNSAGTVVNPITTSNVTTSTEIITINYTGPATKLTVYPTYALNFNVSCLYIYAISVIDVVPTEIEEGSIVNSLRFDGESIINSEEEIVHIYTISGSKVLDSKESVINISSFNKGVYIARSQSGKTLKFIK